MFFGSIGGGAWKFGVTFWMWYPLCLLGPALWAFAAGAVDLRPRLAHSIAGLAGLMCAPWIYWREFAYGGWSNSWIAFNSGPYDYASDPQRLAALTILAFTLIVLATATAAWRLLPQKWMVRQSPLRERTWPPLAITFVALAAWFRIAVVPYRVPVLHEQRMGPNFRVLHIEKDGLQIREQCVSVYTFDSYEVPWEYKISWDDRRLFQYEFQQESGSGKLPGVLAQRVEAMLPARGEKPGDSDRSTPLRAWNAEGWYVLSGRGFKAYTTENGIAPPPGIVALFRDLVALPLEPGWAWEYRDVCLGFCYDPMAAMGILSTYRRCPPSESGFACR